MYMHKRQMNTRLNARTYTPTHTFLASYKCIYVDILYVHTHTEYACVRWACVRACVYIHVHKFMFVYICIHHPQTYIHTYDDIHTSGPLFVKMNGSLRAASGKFPASMTEHLKGNTYTNLIYAANSLLRKFSEISTIPKGRFALSLARSRNAICTTAHAVLMFGHQVMQVLYCMENSCMYMRVSERANEGKYDTFASTVCMRMKHSLYLLREQLVFIGTSSVNDCTHTPA